MSFLLKMQASHRKKEERGREGANTEPSDTRGGDNSDAESEVGIVSGVNPVGAPFKVCNTRFKVYCY